MFEEKTSPPAFPLSSPIPLPPPALSGPWIIWFLYTQSYFSPMCLIYLFQGNLTVTQISPSYLIVYPIRSITRGKVQAYYNFNFKTYCEVRIVITPWYLQSNRHREQWSKIENWEKTHTNIVNWLLAKTQGNSMEIGQTFQQISLKNSIHIDKNNKKNEATETYTQKRLND